MRNVARTSAGHPPAREPVPAARLADWVGAGIITQEQADRITAHERDRAETTPPAPARSLLVEALGYVGGVIILVAAVLLATEFWDELGVGGRVAVLGGATALLLAAGIAVPRQAGDQGIRLRAVLWAGATGAFAGFMGLLTSEVLEIYGDEGFLLASGATAVVAVAFWWFRPTALQHLVALVALATAVGATIAQFSDADYPIGIGVWALGVVWFLLAYFRVLGPRRFALGLGASLAVVGALLLSFSTDDAGLVVTLATAAAIAVMAVVMTDLVLLGIGAVGLLVALPWSFWTWFGGGTFAALLALLAAGVILVVTALWIARRRRGPDE
ncbi:DUF2157 domain-containing protein [Myceligenerans pegani]|uniref:DUF2157 domain-containing protein n=1 Tax=Myceligenerans pegani TaxID=2776917 RepID=A0ABR9N3P9_9MICO|nr:DUF2157 domain-containing protein [Myceligenerans sp. TRM 65318]MBE1878277.1 DUF2157 domain-containing protein [Myceligenerans sp. TRM 65318]MBE3020548.1 DUF2157 domain-containing protein [Myceligenerans sp. TRM 65318]